MCNFTPFQLLCVQNFPFIEADFDSLTNYQLMCKIVDYVNKIKGNQDTLTTNQKNLYDAFNNLQKFVDNYFTDLNITNEISEKLDSMAESGALAEIINEDIFNELNTKVNRNTNDIANNTKAINNINNRKYIFIGDSYGVAWTPDGNPESWIVKTARILGLSTSNYYKRALGGAAFGHENNFLNLLQDVVDEIRNTQDESILKDITDVVVGGGRNEEFLTHDNIITGINNFCDYVKSYLPNAKIHLFSIGWDFSFSTRQKLYTAYNSCYARVIKDNICYYPDCYKFLTDRNAMASDGKHPNETGENYISYFIANCLKGGAPIKAEFGTSAISVLGFGSNIGFTTFRDNNYNLFGANTFVGKTFAENVTLNTSTWLDVGEVISNRFICGSGSEFGEFETVCVVRLSSGEYQTVNCLCYFKYIETIKGELQNPHLCVRLVETTETTFMTLTIQAIQFRFGHHIFDIVGM